MTPINHCSLPETLRRVIEQAKRDSDLKELARLQKLYAVEPVERIFPGFVPAYGTLVS